MPSIGEVKKASEIGYEGHASYRYSVCSSCGKERWVRLLDLGQGKGEVCRSCGYPSTEFHRTRLEVLEQAGAKRASELGKPVRKNRDPWYYPHSCSCCGEPTWHQKKDLHRVCKKCAYIARRTMSGANHPNWKGGRYYHEDGYVLIHVPPDSPYRPMGHKTGYILEHRLIIAQHLGRCLLDEEVVHHINGDKQDNQIGNLELLPNDASHLPYIFLQQKIEKLENQATNQQTKIKLLEWRVRELEQANPELAGDNSRWASVETLQEAHPQGGEEKVHPPKKLGEL